MNVQGLTVMLISVASAREWKSRLPVHEAPPRRLSVTRR